MRRTPVQKPPGRDEAITHRQLSKAPKTPTNPTFGRGSNQEPEEKEEAEPRDELDLGAEEEDRGEELDTEEEQDELTTESQILYPTIPKMPANREPPYKVHTRSSPLISRLRSGTRPKDDNHFSKLEDLILRMEETRKLETATLIATFSKEMAKANKKIQQIEERLAGQPQTQPQPPLGEIPQPRQVPAHNKLREHPIFADLPPSRTIFDTPRPLHLRGGTPGEARDREQSREEYRQSRESQQGQLPKEAGEEAEGNRNRNRSRARGTGYRREGYYERHDDWGQDRQSEKRTQPLRAKDLTEFDGDNVEYFIRQCEVSTNFYGEQEVVKAIPKCLKGSARDWFVTLDDYDMRYLHTLDGWKRVMRDAFGEDGRRLKELADERVFEPWRESSNKYFYEKQNLHRRAEPTISDKDLMYEIWRGLEKHAPEVAVMSYRQDRLADFREELHQRSLLVDKRKKERKKSTWITQKAENPKTGGRKISETKTKPSDKGLGLCSICGEDHFRNQCPEGKRDKEKQEEQKGRERVGRTDKKSEGLKGKSYMITAEEYAESSGSEDRDDRESEESTDSSSHFNITQTSLLSFAKSRSIPVDEGIEIIETEKAPSVGEGISWLNGDPLPLEVWLGTPSSNRRTVLGCGDTGGQCLIRHDILKREVPEAEIRTHPSLNPHFNGVGGGHEKTRGFVTIPVYLPTMEVLRGEAGKVVKIWVEFQVVEELDCNLLIGRDASKAYEIDYIESKGIIQVSGVDIPIADRQMEKKVLKRSINKTVTAGKSMVIPPHTDVCIPIITGNSLPDQKTLLFEGKAFVNLEREEMGKIPTALIYKNTPFIQFSNLCEYPLRINKGEVLGEVRILKANTKMTYFSSPSEWNRPCSEPVTPLQYASPPVWKSEIRTDETPNPWSRDMRPSTLDRIWNTLVDPRPITLAASMTLEKWTPDTRDVGTDIPRQERRHQQRNARKEKWDMRRDADVIKYLEGPQGGKARENLALETGLPTHEYKTNRRTRRTISKSTYKTRSIGYYQDPDTLQVDPLGPQEKPTPDERMVEKFELDLEEPIRPAPEFKHLTIMVDKNLSKEMKDQLAALIRRFTACFSFEGRRLGDMKMPPMKITPTTQPSSRIQAYKESPRTSKNIKEAVETLKGLDIIERGSGPIAAPVVMIKQGNKVRFCVDFRAVNELTPLDKYPIPRPDAVFAALAGAQFFSTMDANKGYHQFRIAEEDRWLTAFITEREGLWQYKRVPFGLQNAPAFFQRAMDSLLGRYRWQFALAYIDDVIIWSRDWPDHLQHIEQVLSAFKRVNLTLDERKCNWGFTSVDLLGHRVTRLGLRTLSAKTEAVTALPFPKTVKQLRQILGQFSYYRQFIPRFAQIAEPLTTALKYGEDTKQKVEAKGMKEQGKPEPAEMKARAREMGKRPVEITEARKAAFEELKKQLSSAPVLRYSDFSKPFFLYTDASGRGIGGTLQQEVEGKQHPILFVSRCLTPAEKNYSALELECLGVYWCFCKLSHYLDGSDSLTVVTDHHALQWLWNIKQSSNSRIHRWAMLLNPYKAKIKIIHRPGLTHSNVDPLSRFPIATCFQLMAWPQDDMWKDLSKLYEEDEDFMGHWHDSFEQQRQNDLSSVTVSSQLGRARDQERIQSETAMERLGRPEPLTQNNPNWMGTDVQSVTAEVQLGRVEQEELSPKFRRTEDGVLVREADESYSICIPKQRRGEALRRIHDELGHPGTRRALEYARKHFFWPTMSRDVKTYCKSCKICQLVKSDTSKKPGSLNPIAVPQSPLEVICIDFVEALPPHRRRDSLATITDKLTKAVMLVACKKSSTAEQFAKLYFERVYPVWGVPRKIISDRDRRFISSFWKTLMAHAGTKVALTTAYHLQSDGQSERTNRTIEGMLRMMILELPSVGWVDLLPAIEFAHNSTPHSITGKSPFELLYTITPRTFGDVSIPPLSHSMTAEDRAKEMREQRDMAISALKMAQQSQKRSFDRRHNPISFQPNEIARLMHGGVFKRKNKLDPTSQLVRIVERVTPGAYRIKVPDGSKMHDVISIEHLRKYNQRETDEATRGEENLNEERRIVEDKRKAVRIAGNRELGGKKEYLVIYEDNSDPEWEMEEDCLGWPKLIKEHLERTKPSQRTRPRGEDPNVLRIDGAERIEDTETEAGKGRDRDTETDAGKSKEKVGAGVRRSGRTRKARRFFDEM